MTFNELNLVKPIERAINEKGYEQPTPIQGKAIPQVLKRKDILGVAQTGTGKTAAFAIPIIQLIHARENADNNKRIKIRALIITPTRELAIQIDENIRDYNKYTGLKHTVIFGGVRQGPQVSKIKNGVHILVATPGRLLDLIGQGLINLDDLKIFVLDEADRMLDMGFINDIKKLLQIIPEERQSLFFSATMPSNIAELSKKILDDPIKITVTPKHTAAETVKQFVYYTNRDLKVELLNHIIEDIEMDQVLIFVRTKHGADRLVKRLKKFKLNALAIHGNKSQNQRQAALKDFKKKKVTALIATDIAARGIDIDKLKFVINYDIPNEPETYVHRIGRSGRAGESGIAISICEPEENAYMKDVQRLVKNKVETVEDNPYPQTEKPMTAAEKKEWNKEKQRRKQEFFANRKKSGGGRGGYGGRGGSSRGGSSRGSSEREKPSREKPSRENASKSSSDRRSEDSRKKKSTGNNKKKPTFGGTLDWK